MFNFIKNVFKNKKYKKSDFTKRRSRAYNREYYHSPTDQWLTWYKIYEEGVDCDYESGLSTLPLVRDTLVMDSNLGFKEEYDTVKAEEVIDEEPFDVEHLVSTRSDSLNSLGLGSNSYNDTSSSSSSSSSSSGSSYSSSDSDSGSSYSSSSSSSYDSSSSYSSSDSGGF